MRRIVRNLKRIQDFITIIIIEHKNRGIFVGANVKFQNPQYITFGHDVVLGDGSALLCTDSFHSKRLKCVPIISIGDRFHCTRKFTIQCCNRVVIGNDVLVASNVFIIDYNHGLCPLTDSYLDNDLSISEGVFINDGVWIGNNVVILGGVHIGKKSVIGAGSVVTMDIPPYSIAVGNPAKIVKRYDFAENEWKSVSHKNIATYQEDKTKNEQINKAY